RSSRLLVSSAKTRSNPLEYFPEEVPTEILERVASGLRRAYEKPGAPFVLERNVFEQDGMISPDDDPEFQEMLAKRTSRQPYILTDDEYMQNEPEHTQITLTWYAGDSVLADDKDEVVEK